MLTHIHGKDTSGPWRRLPTKDFHSPKGRRTPGTINRRKCRVRANRMMRSGALQAKIEENRREKHEKPPYPDPGTGARDQK